MSALTAVSSRVKAYRRRLGSSTRLLFGVYLPVKDRLRCIKDPRLLLLHRRLARHLARQKAEWKHAYTYNYYYQGFERIGIGGAKPSERRLEHYQILEYLKPSHRVLDIGSNCGFFALNLARYVASVEGIELNPHLNRIACDTRDWLGIRNATFRTADFVAEPLRESYDIVFSLSNHHTIDGNLSVGFGAYIQKIFDHMSPGGMLFFESHNVWGDGKLGPGDDSDLDAKFDIAEQYFELVKHKMVRCFYPSADIDKLFIVLRRRPARDPSARRRLTLEAARKSYQYVCFEAQPHG
ncbi:MAG: class I SAM-dependent methyltransferase [Deltaproteobacteria bacterium]|nr:class I SAM-dependent methyltransferase [Deltaproteobacteria bacterium]